MSISFGTVFGATGNAVNARFITIPYGLILLNEIIDFASNEERRKMNLFEFRMDWPSQQTKLKAATAAFVSELENLKQVKATVSQAVLDERLSNSISLRNRHTIADVVRGEVNRDAGRSPQEIFEQVKSRLQTATEGQDKVFDTVGDIIESAASFVGKVTEADVGGATSDAYGIANGLRKAFRNDSKLGVEVAEVLQIYYAAKVEAAAHAIHSAFNDTTGNIMKEAFAYRSHHKNLHLEESATNSAARYALRAHNDPVETAAEKATNRIHGHFTVASNPLLATVQMATHNVTQIEQRAAAPFEMMQRAGWLAKGHQLSTGVRDIVSKLVMDATQKEPADVERQLRRDAATLRAAFMELQIPQKHANLVGRRYANESHAPNVTVLFEDQQFRSSVQEIIAANPNAVRSPPPNNPPTLAKITHLQEELDVVKDMIVREGLINPNLQRTCQEDLRTIQEIEKLLDGAPERMQHVEISWGRAPDRQFFGRLRDEVKDSLEVALKVHAEQQQERKNALQLSMRSLMRGEEPVVGTTRRLDRET